MGLYNYVKYDGVLLKLILSCDDPRIRCAPAYPAETPQIKP